MKTSANQKPYVARRAELLSRVFLEDMHPAILLETTEDDCGFDFLLGLETPEGGTRHFAIEVKATENLTNLEFAVSMPTETVRYWKGSNLPLVFLVVDSKLNRFFFAKSFTPSDAKLAGKIARIVLPLHEAETAESMAKALIEA